MRHTLATLALLVGLVLIAQAEKVKPPKVNLKKCCPLGQQLDSAQNCVPGSTDKWVPNILLVTRGKMYTPMGEAPRFFNILYGVRPADCAAALEMYTEALVVSSNGTLFVQEIAKSFLAADFCVDKDVALVCNPPATVDASAVSAARPPIAGADIPANMLHAAGISMASMTATLPRAKLRKCCGLSYVYDRNQTNCVALADDSPHAARQVTNRTAATVDMIYGFPRCAKAVYTIVESFRDGDFDLSSGTVRLTGTGRSFAPAEFCVEHTVDDLVYADVHVFTCAEHFAQQEPEWATGGDKEVSSIVNALIFKFSNSMFRCIT